MDLFQKFLRHIPHIDLLELGGKVSDMIEDEIQRRVGAGEFPALNEAEKDCVRNNASIAACKMYDQRTKLGLHVCKQVVKLYQDTYFG